MPCDRLLFIEVRDVYESVKYFQWGTPLVPTL